MEREALQKELARAYDDVSAASTSADLAKASAMDQIQSLQAEILRLQSEVNEKSMEIEAQKLLHHNNGREALAIEERLQEQSREIEHLQLRLAFASSGAEACPRELSEPPTPRAPSPSGSCRPRRGVCSTVPSLPTSNGALMSGRRNYSKASDRPPAPPRSCGAATSTPRGGP